MDNGLKKELKKKSKLLILDRINFIVSHHGYNKENFFDFLTSVKKPEHSTGYLTNLFVDEMSDIFVKSCDNELNSDDGISRGELYSFMFMETFSVLRKFNKLYTEYSFTDTESMEILGCLLNDILHTNIHFREMKAYEEYLKPALLKFGWDWAVN